MFYIYILFSIISNMIPVCGILYNAMESSIVSQL
jgi:hypothetical protein